MFPTGDANPGNVVAMLKLIEKTAPISPRSYHDIIEVIGGGAIQPRVT